MALWLLGGEFPLLFAVDAEWSQPYLYTYLASVSRRLRRLLQ